MTGSMHTPPPAALRYFALSSILCLLAVIVLVEPGCRKRPVPDLEGLPPGTFDRLTEDDASRFIALGPAMRRLGRDSHAGPERVKLTDGVPQFLAKHIEWIHTLPGCDSVLAAAGLTWPEYRILIYRIFIAAISVGAPEVIREAGQNLDAMDPGVRKNMLKQMAQTRRIVERVPKESQGVFSRHARELAGSLPGTDE